MIICVSMGVTMAFKTLRVSNSEPIRNTWDLLELNEETTEDKPDFRFVPKILLFISNDLQYRKTPY